MGLGIDEKRRMVTQAYPGNSWKLAVEEMPDKQVNAIYYNLKNTGKLKYAKDLKKEKDIYHQITLKEWIENG